MTKIIDRISIKAARALAAAVAALTATLGVSGSRCSRLDDTARITTNYQFIEEDR
jgi:hypothetical protein